MRQRKMIKIVLIVTLLLTLMVSLVACGSKHEPVKVEKNSKEIVQDKNYTEDIKKEKGVLDGQVYVQNGTAIGTMIIKDDVSDADAKKLAQKYADDLKKTYKDMKINVQAVKGGKNVANITLD